MEDDLIPEAMLVQVPDGRLAVVLLYDEIAVNRVLDNMQRILADETAPEHLRQGAREVIAFHEQRRKHVPEALRNARVIVPPVDRTLLLTVLARAIGGKQKPHGG